MQSPFRSILSTVALFAVPWGAIAQDAGATPAAEEAASDAQPTAPAEGDAEPATPTRYTVDGAASDLYVVIRNDTSAMASRFGHDHVIYASQASGTIVWPATPDQSCEVDIKVPVRSLVVDPPGLRDTAGLDDNTIDDSDKASLKKNMWGRKQLDADDHPSVTFRATSCSGTSGTVDVTGKLTIRGTTNTLTVPMTIVRQDGTFEATGSFDTTHTAFGFDPFSATAFGPRNQDRLSFSVRVVAREGGS